MEHYVFADSSGRPVVLSQTVTETGKHRGSAQYKSFAYLAQIIANDSGASYVCEHNLAEPGLRRLRDEEITSLDAMVLAHARKNKSREPVVYELSPAAAQ